MHEPVHDLDLLAAFVEGRLEGAQRQHLMAHLVECDECRRTLAQMGRALANGELPDVRRDAAQHARWQRPRVWLPLAASVVIGAFGLLYWASGPQGTRPTDDELLVRRGPERVVEGKTFRQSSGVWVDTSVDAATSLPSVVVRGPEERAERLERMPQLAPFADLGERVVVVWEGTIYRFEP